MASLQDQLLKAGIAGKKKLKKIKHEQRQQTAKHGKGKPRVDEVKSAAQQAQLEKVAKDRELNKQKQLAAEAKALRAQILQMLKVNRIDDGKGDTAYQFSDGNKIGKLYVSGKQQAELGRGLLAVARFNDEYFIVSAKVAEKVRQRDASVIVSMHSKNAEDSVADDPYAEYEIPEGFDW